MIDLSLLLNNSAAAKNGEAATSLFANTANKKGSEADAAKESFAQHMNRLKPPADEIHELLAQAKQSGAEFPAAETVAESMVGTGYPLKQSQSDEIDADNLALQDGAHQETLPQNTDLSAQGRATQPEAPPETLPEAGEALSSEEISVLFQQMNLHDPVQGASGTGSSGNGGSMAGGYQSLLSAAEVAQRAQVMAQQPYTQRAEQLAQGNGQNGAQPGVQGNALGIAQGNPLLNATLENISLANSSQAGAVQAAEHAARQAVTEQRQINPGSMNPQQTAPTQPVGQNRTSGTEWVRREINVKPELLQVRSGADSMPETQFRAQVQAQAQQAMSGGSQQVPLSGADSTMSASTIQGSALSADNQHNGLAQQVNSPSAQVSQQPGTTATAQAMHYAQLTAQVGSQAWNQQLGQQLIQMAIHNQQAISLRLNPAELGQVLVNLQMDEHGAQLQLVSQNAQARAALEQALPQLREALSEQGIELGQSSVSDQEQQFTEQESDSQSAIANASGQTENENDAQPAAPTEATGVGPDGRVNLYA